MMLLFIVSIILASSAVKVLNYETSEVIPLSASIFCSFHLFIVIKDSILEKERTRKLEKEKNDLENRFICIICCINEVNCVIIPCGHANTCQSCCSKLHRCLICREAIRNRLKIYLTN